MYFSCCKKRKECVGAEHEKEERSQLWKMSPGKNWDAADGQKDTLIRK